MNKNDNAITYDLSRKFIIKKHLTDEENKSLLKELKINPSQKLKTQLFCGNLGLASYIARQYSNVIYEEAFHEAMYCLYKSIISYDVNRDTSFISYATTVINNGIKKHLKNNRNHLSTSSIEDIILENEENKNLNNFISPKQNELDLVESVANKDISNQIQKIIKSNLFTDEERILIYSYYGTNGFKILNQDELAKAFNLSQAQISRKLNKINEKIKQEMEFYNKKDNRPQSIVSVHFIPALAQYIINSSIPLNECAMIFNKIGLNINNPLVENCSQVTSLARTSILYKINGHLLNILKSNENFREIGPYDFSQCVTNQNYTQKDIEIINNALIERLKNINSYNYFEKLKNRIIIELSKINISEDEKQIIRREYNLEPYKTIDLSTQDSQIEANDKKEKLIKKFNTSVLTNFKKRVACTNPIVASQTLDLMRTETKINLLDKEIEK